MATKRPTYKEKYDKMGVNPSELYLRQTGACKLVVAMDEIDGVKEVGDLYCTDGKDYALASALLNPTYECIKCMSEFIIERLKEMDKDKKDRKSLMSFLMSILVYVSSLKKSEEDQSSIHLVMSDSTFSFIKVFLEENTLSSVETSPVRETGIMRSLFGVPVLTDKKAKEKTILVKPTKKVFELK